MSFNARLFVDFWNFQLTWNKRAQQPCNWRLLPQVLVSKAREVLTSQGLGSVNLHETRVYASWEPGRETKLKGWLDSFLDKQPGFVVNVKERHWRKKAIHCRSCDAEQELCGTCNQPLGRAAEKMVDSRIVADMLTLAWEEQYDLALLLTSDADIVPAVEGLQRNNVKVINATWKGHGHELAKAAWASFELDQLVQRLVRP